jgi:hypothetical protein
MSEKDHHHKNSTPVPARLSLRNRVIDHDDIGWLGRRITYAAPDEHLQELGQHLQQEGLVLGRRLPADQNLVTHAIPTNARPLWLEPSIGRRGELTYADDRLIGDLGRITGSLARMSNGRIILGPHAEDAFAVVDFVEEGARQLYLSPGAELWLSDPIDANNLLGEQMQQFSEQFGERFSHATQQFIQGYTEGLAG